MKYIIVGLGGFGASLSKKLTAQSNEVIAIDHKMEKVDLYKEKISHTIQMDATDEYTVAGLPLQDTDVVIIAIGEDQGANILATAVFKNLQVKHLISRAVNPLHEKILLAIGVDEIVHPEEETAERWAKRLDMKHVVDSFQLSDDYSITEAKVPSEYVGKTIKEIEIRNKFNLLILTIIKQTMSTNIFGDKQQLHKVEGVAKPEQILEATDLLIIYGSNSNLKEFLKQA